MADFKIERGRVVTIELPGLTAVRIDTTANRIAIDCLSGAPDPGDGLSDYSVYDLRNGMYGDFHRLQPASECFDPAGCSGIDTGDPEDSLHVAVLR